MALRGDIFYPSEQIDNLEDLLKITLAKTLHNPIKNTEIIQMSKTALKRKMIISILSDTYFWQRHTLMHADSVYFSETNNWMIDYTIFDSEKALIIVVLIIKELDFNNIKIYYKHLTSKQLIRKEIAIYNFDYSVKKRSINDFGIKII